MAIPSYTTDLNDITLDGGTFSILGGGKFTERYFTLLEGARIVPYDISHVITVTGTLLTDDGQEGVYCFNRAPLTAGVYVDIQYVPPQVEVVTITTGSALTQEEHDQLMNASSLSDVIAASQY